MQGQHLRNDALRLSSGLHTQEGAYMFMHIVATWSKHHFTFFFIFDVLQVVLILTSL